MAELRVIKRDGRREDIQSDKITARIESLCYGLDRNFIDPHEITINIVKGMCDGITTVEMDEFSANYISTLTFEHPDFALLAGRIAISNLHKQTSNEFSEAMKQLYDNVDPIIRKPKPLIAKDVYQIIRDNSERLNKAIDHQRDFGYSYSSFRILERTYLMKVSGKIVERPQFMIMRVAIGIHKDDIDLAIETYNLMSDKWFTHATRTLLNAGSPRPQLSSCFLLTMTDDSIEGVYDTLKQCSLISKFNGGIGVNVHCIREFGLLPILKKFNKKVTYLNQGGGKDGFG